MAELSPRQEFLAYKFLEQVANSAPSDFQKRAKFYIDFIDDPDSAIETIKNIVATGTREERFAAIDFIAFLTGALRN